MNKEIKKQFNRNMEYNKHNLYPKFVGIPKATIEIIKDKQDKLWIVLAYESKEQEPKMILSFPTTIDSIKSIYSKAQQFIDSLEGKDDV